jgi:acid phosphatase type 7
VRAALLAFLAALVLAACGGRSPATTAATSSAATPAPATTASAPAPAVTTSTSDPVVAAAGDIACAPRTPISTYQCHQSLTAMAVSQLRPRAVLPLGDNQYEVGGLSAYRTAYRPTWGRFDGIVHPVTGNHEYSTRGAAGYFAYFGRRGGAPGRGYYSFDLGGWHLVALNSNCAIVSCATGSAQVRWLRADLAAHRSQCTLAYWHHPRFSSGPHGNDLAVGPLWSALYAGGADLVLNGHDHDYERFAPQTPAGRADPRRGIREFVVGTGGRSHYPTLIPKANSQRRNSATFGVLALTLHRNGYSWRFVPQERSTFHDSGSGSCH